MLHQVNFYNNVTQIYIDLVYLSLCLNNSSVIRQEIISQLIWVFLIDKNGGGQIKYLLHIAFNYTNVQMVFYKDQQNYKGLLSTRYYIFRRFYPIPGEGETVVQT